MTAIGLFIFIVFGVLMALIEDTEKDGSFIWFLYGVLALFGMVLCLVGGFIQLFKGIS
jgi:hypothetical protein